MLRKIQRMTVVYEDGESETFEAFGGLGSLMPADTVNPGPPISSVSYVTVTLPLRPRMEVNKAGFFTGRRLRSPSPADVGGEVKP